MVQVLQIIFGVCAVLGAADRILHNRFGLGERFEAGFQLLGSMALSMAGIICLAPVLARVLGAVITPVYHLIGQDPAMFGSILACDMGGYQMAMGLADDPLVGRFAGIIAAAILGCTVSFTIPMGMGIFQGEVRDAFARGILYGLIALPAAILLGAVLCGIPVLAALWLSVPTALLAAALILLLIKAPAAAIRGFSGFAAGLKLLTTAGLAVSALQFLTGWDLLPGLTPLDEALRVVCVIGVNLLGALPFAELMRRALKRPMAWLGDRIGIGGSGVMTLLLLLLNATPGLVALPEVNRRGQVVCAAFAVCAASALSAHFAFAMACEPELALPLLVTKLCGAFLAAGIALFMTRRGTAA